MGGKRHVVNVMLRMKRMQESGFFKPSKFYNFLTSLEKLEEPMAAAKQNTKKIIYPEDRLIKIYYERYPEIKSQPIDLNSFEPPFVRRFAWRQMELMKEGVSEREAFEITEMEMKQEKLQREQHHVLKSTARIVQEEEERVLNRAMKEHLERKKQTHFNF